MIQRTLFLVALVFSVLFSGCKNQLTEHATKPNIVFILVDDMGWSDLGCYGNTFHETPNIDLMAAEGMKFNSAYAACPVCSPTRASILTGKYPVSVDITDWIPGRQFYTGLEPSKKLKVPEFTHELKLEEITLAEELKRAGYVSASIGKWHLGDSAFHPEYNGFDLNVAGRHFGSPPDYFWPYEQMRDGKMIRALPELKAMGKEGDYLTDQLTTEAINFIELNKERPFFLYLPYYTVHIPLQGKEELVQHYREKLEQGTSFTHDNPIYAAMVHSLDQNVGRILAALKDTGLEENTLIILTSDNGGLSVKEGPHTPATTNAPLREGKGHLYEGGIREPLIVKWPGKIAAGSFQEHYISSIDYFPTILDIINLKPSAAVDGVSFLPLLNQKTITQRPVFWHYPHYSNQGGKPGSAVRLGDFKLIQFYEDDHLELYNVHDDPGETLDLTTSMPDKTQELLVILEQWKQDKSVSLPVPNPEYLE